LTTGVLVVVSTSRTAPMLLSYPLLADMLSTISAGALYGLLSGV